MVTPRRIRFISSQIAGLIVVVLLLSLLGLFTLERFVILSLIVFLVIAELTGSITVTPRWRVQLRWFLWTGLLIFGFVLSRRILEIFPPELLPW